MSRTVILWVTGGAILVLLGLWGVSLYVEIQKNRAIHTVERRVKVIEKFIGPQGQRGKPGKPGKATKPVAIETLKKVVAKAVKEQLTTTAGPQGKTGKSGIDGKRGPSGPKGKQGVKGDTGSQGPQGIQGQPGAQGPQGIPGPICPPGYVGQTLMIPLKVTDKPVTVFVCVKH